METLKPIYDHLSYSQEMESKIYAYLNELIFKPLFQILGGLDDNRRNAKEDALQRALESGRIVYANGYFIGDFNAAISKQLRGIGATYNKTRKAYMLEVSHLPQDIKLVIRTAKEQANVKLKQIEDFLSAIEGRKLEPLNLETQFGTIISKLDKQFVATTKKTTSRDLEIGIAPHLKATLKEAYTDNLNPYIQNWYDEQVLRLRKQVTKNVSEGFRADSLVKTIVSERGVTARKAKFLARQETSLMVSKYRQIRYEDIGIRKYKWSTSHDVRVRHDHKELNGKIFSFDNPPITDKATGARNNPGEDFNCRCIAIPILSYQEAYAKSV